MKRKNNYVSFIILIVLSFFVFIFSFFMIFKSISFLKQTKEKTLSTKRNITYQIKVKDNKYYDKEILDEQDEYISSSIDTIMSTFLVNIKNKKHNNTTYTYQVDATLSALSNNKIKKSKKYKLVKKKTVTVEEMTNVKVEEKLDINYNHYQEETEKIKKETGKLLQYILKIEMTISSSNKDDKVNDKLALEIPITKQNKKINLKKIYPENKKSFLPKLTFKVINKNTLIGGVLMLIGSIVLFIVSIIIFKRKKEIKKIKKRIMKLKTSNHVKK